jgi:uncharacterized membrane protein YkvA (DUF1232 family)
LLPWAGTPTAAWRFLADPSAPLAQKIVFALALLYVIVPVDALPDLVPVLGWLDDLGVAAVALALLLWTIRPYRQESSSETAVGVAVIDTPGVQLR